MNFKAQVAALVEELVDMAGDRPLELLPQVQDLMEEPSISWEVAADTLAFALDMEVYAATRNAKVSKELKTRYVCALITRQVDQLQALAVELAAQPFEIENARVKWGCHAVVATAWGDFAEAASLMNVITAGVGKNAAPTVMELLHASLVGAC